MGKLESLRSAPRYAARDLQRDLTAALALAAIALPSQMATAHLAGFPPAAGFIAFAAASAGFAAFGANRFIVACADSTIAPIFASGLAAMAAAGHQDYSGLAASFALIVGGILISIGLFRLGWLADLISIPVTTGFLAGIAGHIIISELPSLLGIAAPQGGLLPSLVSMLSHPGAINPISLALGLGVLGVAACAEWLSPRIPGSLLGITAAAAAVHWFSLESAGVAVLGQMQAEIPHLRAPEAGFADLIAATPLAFVVAAIIMVQTAATTRSFNASPGNGPLIGRDFIGIGAANVAAGLLGVFPVDASPPLTETVAGIGGRSKLPALAAAALILGVAWLGSNLLAPVPLAAIAGILIFIALRIVRVRDIVAVFKRAFGEFVLILATFAAIITLPVATGVTIAIVLSLLHGMWSMTRARLITFERVPGTSIWWPASRHFRGETIEGVLVIAYQAPLSFLNAYEFQTSARKLIRSSAAPNLIVLEASSIVEIDFTAAQVLLGFVEECNQSSIAFAVARLEPLRAQEAFERFGIVGAVPRDHFFHSVEEAIRALAKKDE
jgi:MFS superfamily sulfate permease-like transporter